MEKNICRAITFFNNFIPPMESEEVWEFVAFGAVDCIEVKKVCVCDQTSDTDILK